MWPVGARQFDYSERLRPENITVLPDTLTREILLGFWKIHILHHAAEGPVYGQWIADELRRHGYNISPGTLYPLLRRMERHGWLRCDQRADAPANARKEYHLTPAGAGILQLIQAQVAELYKEVIEDVKSHRDGQDNSPASKS
jgi:DNA-binding PadR family transcriptional regulator